MVIGFQHSIIFHSTNAEILHSEDSVYGANCLPVFSCSVLFRTIESLYEELVSEGIIVRHPRIQMSEYAGEYCYLGTTLRQANIEPMPSLSDVRRLVTEYAILPLGNLPLTFSSDTKSVSYMGGDLRGGGVEG